MTKIFVVCMKCAFHWRAKKLVDVRCPKCGRLGRVDADYPDIEVKIRCKPFLPRSVQ